MILSLNVFPFVSLVITNYLGERFLMIVTMPRVRRTFATMICVSWIYSYTQGQTLLLTLIHWLNLCILCLPLGISSVQISLNPAYHTYVSAGPSHSHSYIKQGCMTLLYVIRYAITNTKVFLEWQLSIPVWYDNIQYPFCMTNFNTLLE